MNVLAIETSCDETAVAILAGEGVPEHASFRILGNALLSQAKLHEEYGGVFPTLAKREHQKALVPLLIEALSQARLHAPVPAQQHSNILQNVGMLLEREPALREQFERTLPYIEKPDIDAIAVTQGPGLEPALWVGINFAKALGMLWDVPVIPVNHMEGHIVSALLKPGLGAGSLEREASASIIQPSSFKLQVQAFSFPLLALLISGGHTELVLMKEWLSYELVGQTRDDAVGEAFDKVARMLALPYPGGPHVARFAEHSRSQQNDGLRKSIILPRPMIQDETCDFSFSGLKTAVLYYLKKFPEITDAMREEVARAFEDAVADVLTEKTRRALEKTGARTLVIGGGVSANAHIRNELAKMLRNGFENAQLCVPEKELTGDNAVMIGAAGYLRALAGHVQSEALSAKGNLRLDSGLKIDA